MDELPGMMELKVAVQNGEWPHTMAADEWADAFCKRFPAVPRDDAIGWFANAIMAGFDTATLRLTRDLDHEQARADAAEAECARLRDKYASGTFCPGCDHQRLARYEAEAARDREQARADALLAERDRLQADLARAQREG